MIIKYCEKHDSYCELDEECKYCELSDDVNSFEKNKPNAFQKMPLHWRYFYYLVAGIIIGLLISSIF